jgi:hypothetical protein
MNGTIHVIWTDFQDSGVSDVYYSKSIDGGATYSPGMPVSDDSAGFKHGSSFDVGSDGSLHVAWTDHRNQGSGSDVYYAGSFDGGGSFGPNIMVNDDVGAYSQTIPVLAVDEAGIIHITWRDQRGHKLREDIYYANSTDGGRSFNQNLQVNDITGTGTEDLRMDVDSNGTPHILWRDKRETPTGEKTIGIYYATFSSSRDGFDRSLRINEETGYHEQENPSVAVGPGDVVYIVWEDYRDDDDFSDNDQVVNIYFSKSSDSGASFTPNTRLVDTGNAYDPVLTVDLSSDIHVVWRERINQTTMDDVFYARYTYEGGTVQGPVQVNDAENIRVEGLDVSANSGSPPHVVWDDDRIEALRPHIYYAKGNWSGEGGPLFEWDFDASCDSDDDGDSSNDIDGTGPTPTWAYGDNGVFSVTLNLTDELGVWDSDTMVVTVLNVDPSVSDVLYEVNTLNASILFRIAGEKWHNVEVFLYGDEKEIGSANITRYPGSPNDQMVGLADIALDLSNEYSAIAYYTPEDDPVNGQEWGATPAWFIIKLDGDEKRIHHTFNVRHPETWTWNIPNLNQYIPAIVNFEAVAFDLGSDDLTFKWDFGDGYYEERVYYNDGSLPDPPMSPEVNPITATDRVRHSYSLSGTYTIILTVMDDDSGSDSISVNMEV